MPGLTRTVSLRDVPPSFTTFWARIQTDSRRTLNRGLASQTKLCPRLRACVVALSPAASLADGTIVHPTLVCDTHFGPRTMLTGTSAWIPTEPEPVPFFSLPSGSVTDRRGAQANRASA